MTYARTVESGLGHSACAFQGGVKATMAYLCRPMPQWPPDLPVGRASPLSRCCELQFRRRRRNSLCIFVGLSSVALISPEIYHRARSFEEPYKSDQVVMPVRCRANDTNG
jgi:hypothetical protein